MPDFPRSAHGTNVACALGQYYQSRAYGVPFVPKLNFRILPFNCGYLCRYRGHLLNRCDIYAKSP